MQQYEVFKNRHTCTQLGTFAIFLKDFLKYSCFICVLKQYKYMYITTQKNVYTLNIHPNRHKYYLNDEWFAVCTTW